MVRSHIWLWAPQSSDCPLQTLVSCWQLWGVHPGAALAVLSLPIPWLWTLGAGSGEEGLVCKRLLLSILRTSLLPSVGSTSSSPALLGIREPRSEYDRTHPSMQYYSSQGDAIAHKDIYTGKRPAEDLLEQGNIPCGKSSHSYTDNCISGLVAANCCFPFPFLVFSACGTGQGVTWLCCSL